MQKVGRGQRDIIVIGGSLGALNPLQEILGNLPKQLEATICVVLHVATQSRAPAELLSASSVLPVKTATDELGPERGVVYVAPTNYHLLLEAEGLRVLHGPREHGARPAIDALFRSAAVSHGPRVIGVLLSGALSDGVLGLAAIKDCGGITLVQHPADASNDELPTNALLTSKVDYSIPAADLPTVLCELVGQEVPPAPAVPKLLEAQARFAVRAARENTNALELGERTHFTCPDCDGPIWKVNENAQHFRCDVGHAYTSDSLLAGQARAIERALWVAFRVLNERSHLLERMASDARARGFVSSANGYLERCKEIGEHIATLSDVMNSRAFDPVESRPIVPETDCQPKSGE
jgi:two-component system, chemotaxis family, protein-glutamate methylesterase/glutaminase